MPNGESGAGGITDSMEATKAIEGWQRCSECHDVHEPCSNMLRRSIALDEPANSSVLGDSVSGVFTPVHAKHSKNFLVVDALAIGVDRIRCNFHQFREDQAKFVISRYSSYAVRFQPQVLSLPLFLLSPT